jgi:hypothetical protein
MFSFVLVQSSIVQFSSLMSYVLHEVEWVWVLFSK